MDSAITVFGTRLEKSESEGSLEVYEGDVDQGAARIIATWDPERELSKRWVATLYASYKQESGRRAWTAVAHGHGESKDDAERDMNRDFAARLRLASSRYGVA